MNFKPAEKLPSIESLRELIRYVPETGDMYRRMRPRHSFKSERAFNAWKSRFLGAKIESKDARGYLLVSIDNQHIKAHRAAWAIYYGEWPKNEIDHINGAKDDNRIVNLRDVCRSINMRNACLLSNNTSGYCGVSFHKRERKWQAYIIVDKKQINLGMFKEKREAILARRRAQKGLGFTDRHGKPKAVQERPS